jgi:hypothetical protein
MVNLPGKVKKLIEGKNFANIATLMKNGSPQGLLRAKKVKELLSLYVCPSTKTKRECQNHSDGEISR